MFFIFSHSLPITQTRPYSRPPPKFSRLYVGPANFLAINHNSLNFSKLEIQLKNLFLFG